MTELGDTSAWKSDKLFSMIRKQPKKWLEENEIDLCESCDGTGLRASKLKAKGGYTWDNHSYCDDCYGVGYLHIKRGLSFSNSEKYICPTCQSVGCEECDYTGFVDWIRHAMGKAKGD